SSAGQQATGVVPGSQEDLEQNAGHRVFFGYDQYTLTPQAQATLARQAAWLKEYPNTRVTVSGNCDERGTREYNLALGARRAEAARAYLVSMGVDGSRITTVSYGKERPIDPRSTEDAWSVNRNSTTTLAGVGA
ncbi:MAG: peptidoglycan-associated lipoprotein Pal, partial [Amphiplicatus sp.]